MQIGRLEHVKQANTIEAAKESAVTVVQRKS